MGAENIGIPGERRLNTWKEIAGFFGRDERTVKRWEASRGLPVRRLPNGPRSTVYAYERELAAWLHEGGAAEAAVAAEPVTIDIVLPAQKPRRMLSDRRSLLAVGAAVLAIVLVALIVASPVARAPLAIKSPAGAPMAGPSSEAASFYRAGLYEWQTRTPEGLARAVDDFTQAIVHDPAYAEAYAGLANCYNLLREFSTMPPEEAYPRAKAAAERAIALKPSLGEAHADLAFVDFYWSRDIAGARREFRRALALEPRSAMAHHWYATFLMTIGEFPNALREIETAQTLDSESTAILADKALILFYNGRADDAVVLLQRLQRAAPAFLSTHLYLARIDLVRGDNAGFLRELNADAAVRHDAGGEALAASGKTGLDGSGRTGMFRAMLTVEKKLYGEGRFPAYSIASTYANLDDAGDALAWLRVSLSRHEAETVVLAIDPSFARLRKVVGFRSLLTEAGLPAG